MENKKLVELAQRIIDIDFYGARDADETPQTIADKITSEPETIILYLLDTIDNLNA